MLDPGHQRHKSREYARHMPSQDFAIVTDRCPRLLRWKCLFGITKRSTEPSIFHASRPKMFRAALPCFQDIDVGAGGGALGARTPQDFAINK